MEAVGVGGSLVPIVDQEVELVPTGKKELCNKCGRVYKNRQSLRFHLWNKHDSRLDKEDKGGEHTCPVEGCAQKHSTKDALRMHLSRAHKTSLTAISSKKPIRRLKCPGVDESGRDACAETFFANRLKVENHLRDDHKAPIEAVNKIFLSMSDFEEWLCKVQLDSVCRFAKGRKLSTTSGGRTKVVNLYCNRSLWSQVGRSNRGGKRAESTPRLSSAEDPIVGTCPARVTYYTSNMTERVVVRAILTHFGHSRPVKFMRLKNTQRDALILNMVEEALAIRETWSAPRPAASISKVPVSVIPSSSSNSAGKHDIEKRAETSWDEAE